MLYLLLNAETQELLREGLVASYHNILKIMEKGFFNNYFTSYIKESTCSLETKVKHFSMEFLLNRKHFKILECRWASLVQKVLAR